MRARRGSEAIESTNFEVREGQLLLLRPRPPERPGRSQRSNPAVRETE
jgi:hypothetical protein